MAAKHNKSKVKEPKFDRPIERYFFTLDHLFQGNRWLYALAVFALFFGVMGLVWMVPFPRLAFLERLEMQDYLNWGSVFIAVVVYSYLKLAPTLSYAMLFTIGVMSFFVVQLEYVERDGGASVISICAVIFLVALLGIYALSRRERDPITLNQLGMLATLGPIWLWSKVFERFGWKY